MEKQASIFDTHVTTAFSAAQKQMTYNDKAVAEQSPATDVWASPRKRGLAYINGL